jgi:hypothetical protein
MCRPLLDCLSFVSNGTLGDRLHAGDRVHERCLAGTIGSDQRDNLARVDVERHAVQNFNAAVSAFDIFN